VCGLIANGGLLATLAEARWRTAFFTLLLAWQQLLLAPQPPAAAAPVCAASRDPLAMLHSSPIDMLLLSSWPAGALEVVLLGEPGAAVAV